MKNLLVSLGISFPILGFIVVLSAIGTSELYMTDLNLTKLFIGIGMVAFGGLIMKVMCDAEL